MSGQGLQKTSIRKWDWEALQALSPSNSAIKDTILALCEKDEDEDTYTPYITVAGVGRKQLYNDLWRNAVLFDTFSMQWRARRHPNVEVENGASDPSNQQAMRSLLKQEGLTDEQIDLWIEYHSQYYFGFAESIIRLTLESSGFAMRSANTTRLLAADPLQLEVSTSIAFANLDNPPANKDPWSKIPGTVSGIFELTEKGMKLLKLSASNAILAALVNGTIMLAEDQKGRVQALDACVQLATGEEVFNSILEKLNKRDAFAAALQQQLSESKLFKQQLVEVQNLYRQLAGRGWVSENFDATRFNVAAASDFTALESTEAMQLAAKLWLNHSVVNPDFFAVARAINQELLNLRPDSLPTTIEPYLTFAQALNAIQLPKTIRDNQQLNTIFSSDGEMDFAGAVQKFLALNGITDLRFLQLQLMRILPLLDSSNNTQLRASLDEESLITLKSLFAIPAPMTSRCREFIQDLAHEISATKAAQMPVLVYGLLLLSASTTIKDDDTVDSLWAAILAEITKESVDRRGLLLQQTLADAFFVAGGIGEFLSTVLRDTQVIDMSSGELLNHFKKSVEKMQTFLVDWQEMGQRSAKYAEVMQQLQQQLRQQSIDIHQTFLNEVRRQLAHGFALLFSWPADLEIKTDIVRFLSLLYGNDISNNLSQWRDAWETQPARFECLAIYADYLAHHQGNPIQEVLTQLEQIAGVKDTNLSSFLQSLQEKLSELQLSALRVKGLAAMPLADIQSLVVGLLSMTDSAKLVAHYTKLNTIVAELNDSNPLIGLLRSSMMLEVLKSKVSTHVKKCIEQAKQFIEKSAELSQEELARLIIPAILELSRVSMAPEIKKVVSSQKEDKVALTGRGQLDLLVSAIQNPSSDQPSAGEIFQTLLSLDALHLASVLAWLSLPPAGNPQQLEDYLKTLMVSEEDPAISTEFTRHYQSAVSAAYEQYKKPSESRKNLEALMLSGKTSLPEVLIYLMRQSGQRVQETSMRVVLLSQLTGKHVRNFTTPARFLAGVQEWVRGELLGNSSVSDANQRTKIASLDQEVSKLNQRLKKHDPAEDDNKINVWKSICENINASDSAEIVSGRISSPIFDASSGRSSAINDLNSSSTSDDSSLNEGVFNVAGVMRQSRPSSSFSDRQSRPSSSLLDYNAYYGNNDLA